MLSLFRFARKSLPLTLVVSAFTLLSSAGASASTVDYTFTGVGTALFDGNPVGPGAFTIALSGDTSSIVNYSTSYYKLSGLDATISSIYGGATLTGASIVVNDASGAENVNLYDSLFTNGIGLAGSPALLGYNLATSVDTGMLTGASLTPTLGSSSFAIQGGGTLQFTGLSSLKFQAVAPTPEPSSLLLLTSGLSGLVVLRRRFVS